ncbi:MAG: hypothetical protein IPP48_03845 [Chitinophagaceae bacterium]|nr:hypothetical protein [Chitinophagaceae bacterium]
MKQTFNFSKGLAFTALFGLLVFTSCKKESNETLTPIAPTDVEATVEASRQDAEAEEQFDDVFNITGSINAQDAGEDLGFGVNVSGLDDLGARTDSAHRCYRVTVVPNIPGVFPKTVTVDFGDGCLGRDGKYRKGKIVSIYTNRMLVPGAKVSTTFLNYFVDSFKIEGTHITENTSTSNMQGWKITVLEGKIINTNTAKWKKWNSTKNVLQIEGNGTPHFPLDDIYKITGGARGSNSMGHTWASIVIEPLIKKFTCRWIVKGTVNLARDGRQALLDYGNGSCDNQAILYINGVGYPINL